MRTDTGGPPPPKLPEATPTPQIRVQSGRHGVAGRSGLGRLPLEQHRAAPDSQEDKFTLLGVVVLFQAEEPHTPRLLHLVGEGEGPSPGQQVGRHRSPRLLRANGEGRRRQGGRRLPSREEGGRSPRQREELDGVGGKPRVPSQSIPLNDGRKGTISEQEVNAPGAG